MGKSTVAALFRRARVPVFDADRAVHDVQRPGGDAVGPIARLVPAAVSDGIIDRARLRDAVAADPAILPGLERIIHPLVRARQARFLAAAQRGRAPFAVVDVPLLFEGGGDRLCDLVITVSAPSSVQRHRVRARRRMSAVEAERIIARQMSDADRRRRADLVIRTGLSRFHATRQVHRLMSRLRTVSATDSKLH